MTERINPRWGAVWAMSLGAFVLVASEFMPVSLLTPIANDLNISNGEAGQSISVAGIFALLTALFLTSIVPKVDRKSILLFFTIFMGISGVVVAFAPNELVLTIGRAMLGICIGGFWSMSAATVMRLVPQISVPKALAILNGGNALSTLIAAPLGSFLGGIIGWRGAFFIIVPLALITFLWLYKSMPNLPTTHKAGHSPRIGTIFGLFKDKQIGLGMLSVTLFFMGQFVLFTYLRPFLEVQTSVSINQLSAVLLFMGFCGLIGTFIIGNILKTRLFSLLIFIPICMAVVSLLITIFAKSLLAMFVLLGFWGLLGTSAPVAWWTWLSKVAPAKAEAAGGAMVAVVQLAIAFGASFGGIVFDTFGYQTTFISSSIILFSASFLAFMTYKVSKFS
ncbi:major facilitator superfamily transporter [Campylobacter iguaniorum]|uniref:Major facilitator superfamily transporter n=1 Tax=Campylobacter iguaniorum TaxID=1244531 RepID=A0A076F7G1_9BACT|nr:MFS transporter [Campylobacter iguaniorum]AII14195.1 major facilitator superfamily transporter [Campylobacter iguaniorum]